MANPSKLNSTEDWQLAKMGIDLLINNKITEAEELFKLKLDSIQMMAGHAFVTFMNALMSYEDDKLTLAFNTLKETETCCANNMGWLKTMKNKVFGTDTQQNLAANLEQQIILADTQVCIAILTFLQQEFSGFIKGGWVLRKAWKIYQHVYIQIFDLHQKTFGDTESCGPNPYQLNNSSRLTKSSTNGSLNSSSEMLSAGSSCEWSVPNSPTSSRSPTPVIPENVTSEFSDTNKETNTVNGYNHSSSYSIRSKMSRSASSISIKLSSLTHSLSYPFGFISSMIGTGSSLKSKTASTDDQITRDEIKRLMCAASFGYGVFQLCISLLPPAMLRLTQLFGFGADRKAGLECLMYARQGSDMRSPLATLSLLWYHTIVRPFFALDGCNVKAGVESAMELINESQTDYGQSALFLFFYGRVDRLLSNIPKALESYQKAVDNSAQREITLLCLHEIGWCHLIQLDYAEAKNTFTILKQRSRWSRSFYAYLSVICTGACGNLVNISQVNEIKAILECSAQKGSQLELYLSRRLMHFPESQEKMEQCSVMYWKLYTYELLYLWNALPSCTHEYIESIIQDCQDSRPEPMVGLTSLIAGTCHYILGDELNAIASYRHCLLQRGYTTVEEDIHVSAFAQYELAMLLLKKTDTHKEGVSLLEKAQSQYKNYDFEHRLNVRIHFTLKNCS